MWPSRKGSILWVILKKKSILWVIFFMTQRIELFFLTWTFFLSRKMGQRIEPFFLEYDSKNWTLFLEYVSKNWTLFLEYDSKNWTFFLNMTQKIAFCSCDSKNWTFFWTWLKGLIHLSKIWETLSVAPAALNVNLSKVRVPFDERSSSLIHQFTCGRRTLHFLSWHSSCVVVAQCLSLTQ